MRVQDHGMVTTRMPGTFIVTMSPSFTQLETQHQGWQQVTELQLGMHWLHCTVPEGRLKKYGNESLETL